MRRALVGRRGAARPHAVCWPRTAALALAEAAQGAGLPIWPPAAQRGRVPLPPRWTRRPRRQRTTRRCGASCTDGARRIGKRTVNSAPRPLAWHRACRTASLDRHAARRAAACDLVPRSPGRGHCRPPAFRARGRTAGTPASRSATGMPGPVVLDLQHDHLAERVGRDPGGDGATRAVCSCSALSTRLRTAALAPAPRWPRKARQRRPRLIAIGPLVAHVDAAVHCAAERSRCTVSIVQHRPGPPARDRLHRRLLILGAGHRQQLVDHVRRALAAQTAICCSVCFIEIGSLPSPRSISPLRDLGLHAQAGQRRLQLVRGVGQEVASASANERSSRCNRSFTALHQRRHLLGHIAARGSGSDRRCRACACLSCSSRQRPDATRRARTRSAPPRPAG